MKKSIKIIIWIIIVLIFLFLIVFTIDYNKYLDKIKADPIESNNNTTLNTLADDSIKTSTNMSYTKKAIIIKVNKNSLDVMDNEIGTDLYSVSFSDEGNIGFKQGQEILIYFDGLIAETFPSKITNVGKIEILKEKTNVEIPDDVLRFYYNSYNNVSVLISDFTPTGISLTITDTNELNYEYSNKYLINKKNKETENVTVDTNKIIPPTENSTSAYIPNNIQVLWEEAPKISNILSEDTGIFSSEKNILKKVYDWSNLYGVLEERRI